MDLYTKTSYELARSLTERYSTSFSMASTLFPESIRKHIYAIYGVVRIADEIVDSYRAPDAAFRLQQLHHEVANALQTGYSTNPIVHAFAITAQRYSIDASLIDPFFESMATDLSEKTFSKKAYDRYIYGSAEVVGLMCLKVFTDNHPYQYQELEKGARALGSAYQKVNFLRDMHADYSELGRIYFPGVTYESFDDATKLAIINDIKSDFRTAEAAIQHIPRPARRAVRASYAYYFTLLKRLEKTPAKELLNRRIRVPDPQKLALYVKARFEQ